MTRRWDRIEGQPFPLGAQLVDDGTAWNFALRSKHAESMTLLLFGADPTTPIATRTLDPFVNKSGPIWHVRVGRAEAPGARSYAWRATGPSGGFHRFDPQKILLDPYARGVWFPPAFSRAAARAPGANDGRAPLGLLPIEATFDWEDDVRPIHHGDAVVYEIHVRGLTQSPSSGIPATRRGTYLGVVDMIPYLVDLGVTVLCVMPVFQFDPQEGNYWGYMPISYFSPHLGFGLSDDPHVVRDEFREMVKQLHRAGIEVILDVVFNHTGEGDDSGPTYSWRGLDNATYYLEDDAAPGTYADFSGTGNTFNTAHATPRRMIVDALAWWVEEMHVDGFRFDLAGTFSRKASGELEEMPELFAQIRADARLNGLRLVAEPWDAGGTYLLGRDFPGFLWSQWNDRFRDDLRRFVRAEPGLIGTMCARMYGSDDLFPGDARTASRPTQTINYIASHDGFSLYDLVSYEQKRNEANGHDNADGPAQSLSWNCGFEGDDGVPAHVLETRYRQARNYALLLMLANGVPMFRMGDEFLQTQGGNTNPYNQDNETSWLDWSRLDDHRSFHRFMRGVIGFRKQHPMLAPGRFWRENVSWFGATGAANFDFETRAFAFCVEGAAYGDGAIYVMINAHWDPAVFTVQVAPHERWTLVADTGLEPPDDLAAPGTATPLTSADYPMAARSVALLYSETSVGPT